jgi:hypothetical protein
MKRDKSSNSSLARLRKPTPTTAVMFDGQIIDTVVAAEIRGLHVGI